MSGEFDPIRVLGMMSGTSLDGVDAAVLETDGIGAVSFGKSGFEPYSDQERDVLRQALGKWPGPDLEDAEEIVLGAHARLAARFEADVIGFHGQTLAHDPDKGRTHQLGDGAKLAALAGRKVVWDFRTLDMKEGGQGAPLAPFYHHALAKAAGLTEPVAFLNLGGVANVTWADPRIEAPEDNAALLAFDTGPANALLDDFLSKHAGMPYDEGGAFAARGVVHPAILNALDGVAYLDRPAPKSLDRDDFAHLLPQLDTLKPEDGAATLTTITASCVGRAIPHLPDNPQRWFVCGGGRHNKTMIDMISSEIGRTVEPVEVIGFDGDMLEAQAFAWLAVRVMRRLPTSAPTTTGCRAPVGGGQVSSA